MAPRSRCKAQPQPPAMASLCNDAWGFVGNRSGHDGRPLILSTLGVPVSGPQAGEQQRQRQ